MLTNLMLFRNELKNKHVERYKFIGIIVELTINKDTIDIAKQAFDLQKIDLIEMIEFLNVMGYTAEQKKLLYKLIDKRIQELQKDMKKQKNILDNYYI